MKPISLVSFLGAMLVLGISLLWFPNMVSIMGALLPAGTPTWAVDFVSFIPYGALSAMLIMFVIKLTKRGRRDDIHE